MNKINSLLEQILYPPKTDNSSTLWCYLQKYKNLKFKDFQLNTFDGETL